MDQDQEEEETIGQAEIDILILQAREGELDGWMELVRYSKQQKHAIRILQPSFQDLVLSIASNITVETKRDGLIIQLLEQLVHHQLPGTESFLFLVCLSWIVHQQIIHRNKCISMLVHIEIGVDLLRIDESLLIAALTHSDENVVIQMNQLLYKALWNNQSPNHFPSLFQACLNFSIHTSTELAKQYSIANTLLLMMPQSTSRIPEDTYLLFLDKIGKELIFRFNRIVLEALEKQIDSLHYHDQLLVNLVCPSGSVTEYGRRCFTLVKSVIRKRMFLEDNLNLEQVRGTLCLLFKRNRKHIRTDVLFTFGQELMEWCTIDLPSSDNWLRALSEIPELEYHVVLSPEMAPRIVQFIANQSSSLSTRRSWLDTSILKMIHRHSGQETFLNQWMDFVLERLDLTEAMKVLSSMLHYPSLSQQISTRPFVFNQCLDNLFMIRMDCNLMFTLLEQQLTLNTAQLLVEKFISGWKRIPAGVWMTRFKQYISKRICANRELAKLHVENVEFMSVLSHVNPHACYELKLTKLVFEEDLDRICILCAEMASLPTILSIPMPVIHRLIECVDRDPTNKTDPILKLIHGLLYTVNLKSLLEDVPFLQAIPRWLEVFKNDTCRWKNVNTFREYYLCWGYIHIVRILNSIAFENTLATCFWFQESLDQMESLNETERAHCNLVKDEPNYQVLLRFHHRTNNRRCLQTLISKQTIPVTKGIIQLTVLGPCKLQTNAKSFLHQR